MRQFFFSVLLIFLGTQVLFAQDVQWASKVIGFSSEYDEKQYSATQVLGKPNVLPQFKDSPCAWSPRKEQNPESEWISVGFAKPSIVQQIAIAESHNPGAVSRVYLYDTEGREYLVYKAESNKTLVERGRMLHIIIKPTEYRVKSVKIVLNTQDVIGWNHIDAIGISGSTTPVEASINLAENLEFDSKPQNLGTGINSRYDEIMPIISPDGRTLYFDRKDHPENTKGKINDDIWVSHIEGGHWTQAKNIGAPLNNDGHNFLSALTPDGHTILLGNVYESDGSMSSGLSISHWTGSSWEFPQKLQILNYYNRNKYSEFHMGTNGNLIVMTIERDDSYGGKDIYVSFRQTGTLLWTEPKNLGSMVNSAGTEMSPFLAADGRTLYFSSNGFSGYGSNDMYMSRRLDDSWTNWTEPKNLGPAINSPNWDAYYSIPAAGDYAYFSSENHSIGKTDIFKIKLPLDIKPDPVVLITGRVLNEKTGKPIGAEIVYETLEDGVILGTAYSSPTTGDYKIVLPAGAKYGLHAKAEGHLSINENIDLTGLKAYEEVQKDLFLVELKIGETVILNNIFFQPSSSELASDSKPELNRVVSFMKENPRVKIEVAGHTNNSCSEEWCHTLSTMRAKSVANYLLAKGVDESRITYKGYGSRKPILSNETAEGKRKNRRVEFRILEI